MRILEAHQNFEIMNEMMIYIRDMDDIQQSRFFHPSFLAYSQRQGQQFLRSLWISL